jgi:hypothetical protein
MDPYLEDPDIWFDFHHSYAVGISAELNQTLPRPYYSRINPRGAEDREQTEDVIFPLDVEVRDARDHHALVTFIEIVTPLDKQEAESRAAYLAKQSEVLGSPASLIEIDLSEVGARIAGSPLVYQTLRDERGCRPRYLVCMNRASDKSRYEIYPFGLMDRLPVIPVPLRDGEPIVALGLQTVFDVTYDRGPYVRGAVDYTEPPPVFLTDDERKWVRERVVAAFPNLPECDS